MSSKLFLCGLSLFLLLLGAGFSRAQTTAEVEARRAELQAQLEAEEKAIAEQTLLLQAKQRDTATVAGEINLLKSQIARAQASIKAKKVAISGLDADIASRETKIKTLAERIKQQQNSLAELLRQVRETQELSLVEVMLDGRDLSEIFSDVDASGQIEQELQKTFEAMRASQDQAREEQVVLGKKKNAEIDAQKVIESEQKLIQQKEADKRVVLAINKNQEQAYQTILVERQRRAAQIRAALFALRDSAAIPFGKALEFATAAGKKTGVRPAFILAILQQESNLGANVGTCNRPGDPPERLWTRIMPGPAAKQTYLSLGGSCKKAKTACSSRDDQSHFLGIMKSLGRDPGSTPLSCPILSAGPWGGAMGPAQFIPSTWALFVDRLKSSLGVSVPDPWEPEHAFMASALYLADLGGINGSYTGEIAAACRYYGSGGGTCVYGTQVMARAANIQTTMINPLLD